MDSKFHSKECDIKGEGHSKEEWNEEQASGLLEHGMTSRATVAFSTHSVLSFSLQYNGNLWHGHD